MSDVRTYQILEKLRHRLDCKLASCHPNDNDNFDMLMEISTWVEEEMSELELPPGWLQAKLEKDIASHHYDLDQ